MKIAVIGTGYVGLVTGTCFSETGNYVTCVDIDKSKVDRLNSGQITIYEPGLEKIFLRNIKEGRLKFTTKLEEVIEDSQIIFLALPTPPDEDGSADLKYVLNVANKLGKILNGYKVIVNKSTVPVGTADKVKKTIELNYKGKFDIVSNPEFLREGVAVDDFMKPDRIVVGTNSEKAKKLISQLYAPFVRQGNPIIFMDTHSSELTKYAANSFLATKISFMNEIAQLCERMGANVDDVRRGIGTDERIGKRFLFPGIGYGGSCFPKDVKALINSSEKINYDFKILKSVEKVNSNQKLELINKINFYYNNDLKGKHFGLWGLAFKPNTDDIREAPALNIINELIKRGASLNVYDPEAMANVKDLVGDKVKYSNNQYDAIKNVDALIIATEWNEFRTPNFDLMKTLFKNKVIFDGRNLYQIEKMIELGYHYESIGRPIY
ncbi:MAG: UDP-glucose/GDP-mannose dehydrogenase family protein [Flavobacteriaceae bacterium]|jgi:UDPglucose 6-dehydrogenase|nr:UDP-glucose/GDP-mannose dehydrogenase family protein [Flavobacteriaceae bacterium]